MDNEGKRDQGENRQDAAEREQNDLDLMIDVIHKELQARKDARNRAREARGETETGEDGSEARAREYAPEQGDKKAGEDASGNEKTRVSEPIVKRAPPAPNKRRDLPPGQRVAPDKRRDLPPGQRAASGGKGQQNKEKIVYFDDIDEGARKRRQEEKKAADAQKKARKTQTKKRGLFGFAGGGLLRLILYMLFVGLSVYFLSSSIIKIGNDMFAFAKGDREVVLTLPEQITTQELSRLLEQNGLIQYPKAFTIFANFRISKRPYLSGKYIAGEHTLYSSMNYDQLIEQLSLYEKRSTVRVTIPEGLTANETMALLVEKGVKITRDEFIDALQTYEYDYRFISRLSGETLSPFRTDSNYSYRLEGYLFPDTYEFYTDESAVSVINKLLMNFDNKFEEAYYDRCDRIGYTVDQILTLASLIEKEAGTYSDFPRVSSVFHNRMLRSDTYPRLESDATIQYAYGERKSVLDSGDTKLDHPYNTYLYPGLPPGPICNPGIEAIIAALYPEQTDYLYFVTGKGITKFSKTYDEHQRAINELLHTP